MTSAAGHSSVRPRVSAPVYFLIVAVLTTLGLGLAMLLRPAFAYSVRSALGLEKEVRPAPGSFYSVRVAPLFEEHCIGCHGARRQKADLRLDTFSAALHGSRHGPVIVKGDSKHGELVTRLMLPPENAKAMPPSGKPPLSADEVQVVRLWIAAGASGSLPVAAIPNAPPPLVKVEIPRIDEAAVARARAPLAQVVEQLQARFPGVLSYESRASADLQINASWLGNTFGDAELAAFAPLRERIVWADLSDTSVSDASAQTLSEYKHLRTLRLAYTRVADPTARALTSLDALKALTVVGARISGAALATLQRKGVRIYDGRDASASNAAS